MNISMTPSPRLRSPRLSLSYLFLSSKAGPARRRNWSVRAMHAPAASRTALCCAMSPPSSSGERCSNPVEQRAVVGVVLTREPGQQPIAVGDELVRNAYADGVFVLPGIVADQAGQQPDRHQDEQGKTRERQRDAQAATIGWPRLGRGCGRYWAWRWCAIACSSEPLIDAHSRSKVSLTPVGIHALILLGRKTKKAAVAARKQKRQP